MSDSESAAIVLSSLSFVVVILFVLLYPHRKRIKKISKPYLSRFRGQVVRRSGAPKAPRRLNRRPKPNAGVVAIATDDDVRDVHVVHDEQRDQPVLQLDSSFTDSSSSEGDDGEIAGGPVLGTYKTNRESHVSHFEDVATHV